MLKNWLRILEYTLLPLRCLIQPLTVSDQLSCLQPFLHRFLGQFVSCLSQSLEDRRVMLTMLVIMSSHLKQLFPRTFKYSLKGI